MPGRDEMTGKGMSRPGISGSASRSAVSDQNDQPEKGVLILGLRPESSSEKAGLRTGDVIIQYDGVGDLTREKLAGLTAATRPQDSQVPVVFVREGQKRTLPLSPGSLEIQSMDTTTQIFSQSNFHRIKQEGKPLFVLKYRGYKVFLRAISYSGAASVFAAAAFVSGPRVTHTGLDLLGFVLFQIIASFIVFLGIYLVVDMVLLKGIRIYKDRIVRVWNLPGPVEFATARHAGFTSLISHKFFFDKATNRFVRLFTGVFYDESLADAEEIKKLNRLLAELSGRNVEEFERFHIRETRFIKENGV